MHTCPKYSCLHAAACPCQAPPPPWPAGAGACRHRRTVLLLHAYATAVVCAVWFTCLAPPPFWARGPVRRRKHFFYTAIFKPFTLPVSFNSPLLAGLLATACLLG